MRHLLLTLLFALTLFSKEQFNISLVVDGKVEYKENLEKALKEEIIQLVGRDFDVKFSKKHRYSGGWDYIKIADSVNKALRDDGDLVITIGGLSSHYAARKPSYRKPLVATTIIDPIMQKVPYKNGHSNKKNMTYSSGFFSIKKDIETMRELKEVKKVAVLLNATMIKNTPSIGKYVLSIFKKKNIEATIIPVSNNFSDLLDTIDPDTDMVYATPLFHLNDEKRREMYLELRLKELASFSALGRDDVELGALFGNVPPSDKKRLIRHIALQVQQIALGASASKLDVNFAPYSSLSMNTRTAIEIGYAPSWELLSKCDLVDNEKGDSHTFSMQQILDRAVAHNLSVISATHQVKVSEEQKNKAEAALLPQIQFGADIRQIDQDRAVASMGTVPEFSPLIKAGLFQNLYNQQYNANISINESFLSAKTHKQDQLKLDVALQASLAYLQILHFQSRLAILKDNLELSKKNLRSSITKREIGLGHDSDIFRWESKISSDKKNVVVTHSALVQARYTLNALLDLPQKLQLNLINITQDDPVFMTHHAEIEEYLKNPKDFLRFESFLVIHGKAASPEIFELEDLKSARKRLVESNNDAYYLPSISIEGSYLYSFGEGDDTLRKEWEEAAGVTIPAFDANSWDIGVYLKYSVFEGGAKSAALEESRAAFLATEAETKNYTNIIEKNIRNGLYQAKASYLSITLSHQAYVAAKKNLDLIGTVYVQGSTDILHLLDAQSETLRAALLENDTRFGFMKDLLKLQRGIGQVNFNIGDEKWSEFITALDSHVSEE